MGDVEAIPSREDERDLVDRLRSGDERAFRGLVERYHRPLVRLALTHSDQAPLDRLKVVGRVGSGTASGVTPRPAHRHILRKSLEGHDSQINTLAFSTDGRTLASGSEDSTVKLWNLALGLEAGTLRVNWYHGDANFGQAALEAAQAGLQTWASNADVVITDTTLVSYGQYARKFYKLLKKMRFRQIYFKIEFDIVGNTITDDSSIRVYDLTAFVKQKETVVKEVS
jgi:WD40 repeat protein